ncbi:MAG: hypothetical protein QXT45_07050 [Candidatus Bilamarchaeaceae archaeon]
MNKILEYGIDYVMAWLLAVVIYISYVYLLIAGIQPTEAVHIALGAATGYVFGSVTRGINGRYTFATRTINDLPGNNRKT